MERIDKELVNNGRVEFLVNVEPREYPRLLNDMCYNYRIVFGGHPYNEGGLHEDGNSTISLIQYADHLVDSSQFQEDKFSDYGLHRVCKGDDHDTKSLVTLLKWFDNLDSERRSKLVKEVKLSSDGYEPYYSHKEVMTRFQTDLAPKPGSTPIVSYWKDEEHGLCGFLTAVAVNRESFLDVVKNTPYLTRGFPNIEEQVSLFLKDKENVEYLLLESEGLVIPERRGKENGSRWPELLGTVREKAIKLGAQYSSGFTSTNGRYFEAANKLNLLTHTYDLEPVNSQDDKMIFFLSSLTN